MVVGTLQSQVSYANNTSQIPESCLGQINHEEDDLTASNMLIRLLVRASRTGDISCVRSMLDGNLVPVNEKYGDGSALFFAANFNQLEMVRYLLSRNDVDVNTLGATPGTRSTPLLIALRNKSDDVALALINDPRTNLNIRDAKEMSTFGYALEGGNATIKSFRALLSNPRFELNDPRYSGVLFALAYSGAVQDLETFLQRTQANINSLDSKGQTALTHAAASNNIQVVNALLAKSNIQPNARGSDRAATPLIAAVAKNSEAVVRALLADSRVDVNLREDMTGSALDIALLFDDPASSKVEEMLLRDPRVNLNTTNNLNGHSPLMRAVTFKNVEYVRIILSRPHIDLSIKGEDGKTALDLAIESGESEIIRLIQNYGK